MRDRAKMLLAAYFQTLFEEVGNEWSEKNQAEVEEIVDLIADSAVDQAEALSEDNYVDH